MSIKKSAYIPRLKNNAVGKMAPTHLLNTRFQFVKKTVSAKVGLMGVYFVLWMIIRCSVICSGVVPALSRGNLSGRFLCPCDTPLSFWILEHFLTSWSLVVLQAHLACSCPSPRISHFPKDPLAPLAGCKEIQTPKFHTRHMESTPGQGLGTGMLTGFQAGHWLQWTYWVTLSSHCFMQPEAKEHDCVKW